MNDGKMPLLVVAGPTASGKTSLAVALAKALDGEVVSADSMQVYAELQVATARPTEAEMQGVPHHLLGHVSVSEAYSVAKYAQQARTCIADIATRHKWPILCGGTGLYIAAVTDNVRYEPQDDEGTMALRERLKAELQEQGEQQMWERLNAVDPALAQSLHPHNRGRILRALEVFEMTGVPMSEQQRRQKAQPSPYNTTMITLDFHDRQLLYNRIDRRVEQMLQNGLLEETARVVRLPSKTAQQAIGCKEFTPYFNGDCTLSEAVEMIKRRSRQYAKRQLSWFRRIDTAHTLYVDEYGSPSALAQAALDIVNSGKETAE